MIVTLCGSTRFEQEFIDAQRELCRRGVTCFSLAVLPQHRNDDEKWEDGGYEKTMGDLVHLEKIAHSDAILVVGDGYIGFSTAREISWAVMQDKTIISLNECNNDWQCAVECLTRKSIFSHYRVIEKARSVLKGALS